MANLLIASGAQRIISFDLPFDHLTVLDIFVSYFKKKNLKDLTVVSPDLGRVELSKKFADRLGVQLVVNYKEKESHEIGEMTLLGDVSEKRVLVVDDMIDTASTLIKTINTLIKAGAKEIYACATNPLLFGEAIKILSSSSIKEIVFLNTIPIEAKRMLPNFRILSVGSILAKVIKNIHEYKSVSQSFL